MDHRSYPPARQRGSRLHLTLIILFSALLGFSIWQAVIATNQSLLILWSLLAFTFVFPLPFLVYRFYALQRGNYTLSRESFTIRWGLRLEQVPISDVEWVRPAQDLTHPLRLPFFSMPGAVLGLRKQVDIELVEFLAGESSNLLLVATARRVFAISPADQVGFIQDFQRTIEMGSLLTAAHQSQFPSFVIAQAWQNKPTRVFWLVGLLLNIFLIGWIAALIPKLGLIPLGFITPDLPRNLVPGVQLLIIPVISSLFFLVAWVAGLVAFRRPRLIQLAVLIWGFSSFSAILFLLSVFQIISARV